MAETRAFRCSAQDTWVRLASNLEGSGNSARS